MKEENKLPRPSAEILNQFDELCRKSHDPQLADNQHQEVIDKLNDIITSYNLDNYEFVDPATGKRGVKNPAGQVLVPAEYDGFSFMGDHNVFPLSHMAAKKGDKWGVVMADGTNTVLCDFRFDLLIWNPFTALYEACWEFSYVNYCKKIVLSNLNLKYYCIFVFKTKNL